MTKKASSPKAGKSTSRKIGKSPSRKPQRKDAESPAYTVFISHSSKELWVARQISKEIEAIGAKTWLDKKDLRGGDEIRRTVKHGIRSCQEALVLLSAHSVISQWVIYEVGVADGQGKRVTLILNSIAYHSLAPMQGVKAIDLNDFDDFLLELAKRIKVRLNKSRKAVS